VQKIVGRAWRKTEKKGMQAAHGAAFARFVRAVDNVQAGQG